MNVLVKVVHIESISFLILTITERSVYWLFLARFNRYVTGMNLNEVLIVSIIVLCVLNFILRTLQHITQDLIKYIPFSLQINVICQHLTTTTTFNDIHTILYIYSAQTTQTAMVGSCPLYGGWSRSKRHPLRWAGFGQKNHRPPSPAIQRCLHKRHEGCRHRHYVLGGLCGRSHGVEECSETTPWDRGKETDGCSSRQTSTQKGGQQLHPTRNHT